MFFLKIGIGNAFFTFNQKTFSLVWKGTGKVQLKIHHRLLLGLFLISLGKSIGN